jgi:membrane protein YdbS with pleckstrin-like domain
MDLKYGARQQTTRVNSQRPAADPDNRRHAFNASDDPATAPPATIAIPCLAYNAPFAFTGATMFDNPEIPLDDLPAIEDLEWQALDSGFVWRMLLERFIVVIFLGVGSFLPGLFSGGRFDPTLPLWAFVIVFAVPFLAWPFVAVPRRGYAVRGRDIAFRQGVLFRSVTAIPFNRIQHVETSSTPLDRKFGLAALQLYTAGGTGGDLKIQGVGSDTAEQLRSYVLEKTGASIEDA